MLRIQSWTFSLTFGRFAFNSSPFINAQENNVFGKVCFNYFHFSKNTFANKDEIVIVGTESGCNWRGSFIDISRTLTTLSQGCKFLNDKSIIYHD